MMVKKVEDLKRKILPSFYTLMLKYHIPKYTDTLHIKDKKFQFPKKLLPFFIFFGIMCLGSSSCSFFFSSKDRYQSAKNKYYTITFRHQNWKQQDDPNSDFSFLYRSQSSNASQARGQLLVAKSYCQEFQDASLEELATKILKSFKDFKINKQQYFTFQKREAFRLTGQGYIDGVKVSISLVNTRRNFCYYDFIFIDPSENEEKTIILKNENQNMFNDFLSSVKFYK